MQPPPDTLAIAIGLPLNNLRKSDSCTESQAIALLNTGGIEPLYSGAQTTQ